MTKDAAAKGARGVANATILRSRHMAAISGFAAGVSSISSVAAGTGAIGDNAGMVDKRANEAIGIMTITAVGAGYRVANCCGQLRGRVDAIGFIVT